MIISVIIPTHNRYLSLKETLTSLKNQVISEELGLDYEIIVVDNNSADRTKELVEDMKKQMNGRLKYVFESKKGAAHARNTGIRNAKGEIISFIDDDCTVVKNWINEIALTFKSHNADAVLGRISLSLLSRKPDWIPDSFLRKRLAQIDYGAETKMMGDGDLVTANTSFRAEVFKKFGGFNSRFEPCEDTQYSRMVSKHGIVKFYSPKAEVFHRIPAERLNSGYFLKQSYKWGFVKYMEYMPLNVTRPRTKFFFWFLAESLNNVFIFSWKYLRGRKTERFLALCDVYDKIGTIHYLIVSLLNKLNLPGLKSGD